MSKPKPLDKQWFRDLYKERGFESQRRFAAALEIDHARVSMLFNGKGKQMTLDEAQRFARVLGQPVNVVLLRAGCQIETTNRRVPITGYVNELAQVQQVGQGTEDEVDGPLDLPTDAFALQMRTHNTRAGFLDRWLVFVSGQRLAPHEVHSQLALVTLNDGSQLVGEVREGYKAGTINIHVGSERLAVNQIARWCMRVLWMRPDQAGRSA